MFLQLFFLSLAFGGMAKTVSYNWDITWVWANPDGLQPRPVIGINGRFPCPTIEADLGDTIEVKINNKLGNETTGLHFHGQTQMGTNQMDGPSGVTQCPSAYATITSMIASNRTSLVPPGSSFTYKFTADPAGRSVSLLLHKCVS
jgi:iron transport multicopper oxidase